MSNLFASSINSPLTHSIRAITRAHPKTGSPSAGGPRVGFRTGRPLVPLLLGLIASTVACGGSQTALDRYVAAADPSYSYKLINTVPGKGYTTYVLEMSSQSWLTTNEVDRTLWKHWMTVTKPDPVTVSTSLLFIARGSNEKEAPKEADAKMIKIAIATKSGVAELRMVPNQPL